ncbi:MAG: TSUP family transporter [Myxococcales bacterium]|nr:TSUP family transporter [Myxococcales bacterium]
MAPGTLAALCFAALSAGTIDAMAGGGGLITVPALFAAGLPPTLVFGTNKAQSSFGSFAALWRFWRAGLIVKAQFAGAFAAGFVGSLCGARLVLVVPNAVLRPVVLVLLVMVAALLAFRREQSPRALDLAPAQVSRRAALIAASVGAYDGFFGPGTGTFLIMARARFLGDTLKRASANAKVVNFASNLAALCVFALKGVVLWRVALPMAAAQFVGGLLGARLTVQGGDRWVRRAVLGVVAALVCKLAYDLAPRS